MTVETTPLVFVIDDDHSVRDALTDLLASAGFDARAFSSAAALLSELTTIERRPELRPNCIILDVRMPAIDGLELQERLRAGGVSLQIIFMTGHGDIEMTVKAMRAGASDFFEKPFRDAEMLAAVHTAIERDKVQREEDSAQTALRNRYASLSAHERVLLELIVSGLMNKQIASHLHLSEITIKVHRAELMRKMGASNLVELVKLHARLDLQAEHPGPGKGPPGGI